MVFAAANVLTRRVSLKGYSLLKLIRRYIECNMYIGFEVHTDVTLNLLNTALQAFNDALEV